VGRKALINHVLTDEPSEIKRCVSALASGTCVFMIKLNLSYSDCFKICLCRKRKAQEEEEEEVKKKLQKEWDKNY